MVELNGGIGWFGGVDGLGGRWSGSAEWWYWMGLVECWS